MSWSTCHVNFLTYSFFWSLLPSIPVGPIHSVPWASSTHFVLWASLTCFILSYLLHSHGLLLNYLGFHSQFLLIFFFFYISYNSHEPTISFLGASLICLLSIKPLIILVGLLTIILAILTQWSLFYYSFFLYFSYCWASFAIGPLLSKMGINTK